MKKYKNKIVRFLRWTQKYTKTDMVYLVKGGFWLTLEKILKTAILFFSGIVFANLLDPNIYGNYKYILSLSGLLSICSLIGMRTAVIQAVARGKEDSFYKGFSAVFKWSLIASAISIILAIYYWIRGNHLLPGPLLILALSVPFLWASQVYAAFLIGKKLFGIQTRYSLLNALISTATVVIALLITKDLFWIILVHFVSQAFLGNYFYSRIKQKLKPNKKSDPTTIPFAKALSKLGVISGVSNQIDNILIFTLLGSKEVAIYSLAKLLPDQIVGFLKNIHTLILPKFSERSEEEIRENLMEKFWKLLSLTVIIVVFYVFLSPLIYKLFFPKYEESIKYSQVLILLIFSYAGLIPETALESKKKKRELFLLQVPPIIRIILLVMLIPTFGIWGAIASFVLSKLFRLLLSLFLFYRQKNAT